MTITDRLAQQDQRIRALEQQVREMQRRLGSEGPWFPEARRLCSCVPGSACGNVACPYRVNMTCGGVG